MFKVKRLQAIESLILETDLISIGSEAEDLLNNAGDSGKSGDSSKDSGKSNTDRLNELLDMLFNLGEDDLTEKIGNPAFRKIFSDPRMKVLLDEYFEYLNKRIVEYRSQLSAALEKPEINEAVIKSITDRLTAFVCRVRVIEIIYQEMESKKEAEFSKEINKKVKEINDALSETFSLILVKPAEKTKEAFSKFQGAQTEEAKEEAAEEVFSTLQTAAVLAQEVPEAKARIEEATEVYSERMASEIGKEKIEDIKAGIFINKNVAAIIRRIFEFQYTNWTTERDIITEANKLKTSINGFPDVSQEAKDYLYKLVNQIQVQLIERARSKKFDTRKYKGIHYTFNKKLPLYERTPLPVTGKQIADDTKIMKFRKAAISLISLLAGTGNTELTDAGRAFQQTGAWAHQLYAKTLNTSAKFIGKTIGGREGEMKADAFTRLFIPGTGVLDEPKGRRVSEDVVAPGVSPQVPGSISGMGPITPPTADSIGSGDNFGPALKKKKKSAVLGFSDFLNGSKLEESAEQSMKNVKLFEEFVNESD